MKRVLKFIAKLGIAALIANEIRGIVLAIPVLYTMWQAGGTAMAIWIAFCSLAGIALSVVVPVIGARIIRKRMGAKI